MEKLFLHAVIFSIACFLCLLLYIPTTALIAVVDNINLHNEPIGALVIYVYIVVNYIAVYSLFKNELTIMLKD